MSVEQTIPASRWPGVPGRLEPGQKIAVKIPLVVASDVRTVEGVWRLALTTYTHTHLIPVFRDRETGAMWGWMTGTVATPVGRWVSVESLLRQHTTVAFCLTRDPMPLPTGVIHSGE
jgi:hypothetical protein